MWTRHARDGSNHRPESPMPFGCESYVDRPGDHHSTLLPLTGHQCLSAVSPMWTLDVNLMAAMDMPSPMPFGCESYVDTPRPRPASAA